MKKNTTILILGYIICLISCDTVTHYTIRISVDRHPTLTIINETGHPVVVTAPVSSQIANGARTLFQPTDANRSIDVVYSIGQIQFTERATMSNADATVTLTKRPPTVTVINETGRPVNLITPVSSQIANGARTHFLPPVMTGNFNISYSSGLMRLVEQVTMRNEDVTVTLSVGAPTLTIVNNTGTGNNINIIQFRTIGNVAWIGGNIIIRNNEFVLAQGEALTGVTTQALANGDSLSLWLGSLELSGNTFDIRLQTPNAIFQRDNVRITRDMSLTFTAADRR